MAVQRYRLFIYLLLRVFPTYEKCKRFERLSFILVSIVISFMKLRYSLDILIDYEDIQIGPHFSKNIHDKKGPYENVDIRLFLPFLIMLMNSGF